MKGYVISRVGCSRVRKVYICDITTRLMCIHIGRGNMRSNVDRVKAHSENGKSLVCGGELHALYVRYKGKFVKIGEYCTECGILPDAAHIQSIFKPS